MRRCPQSKSPENSKESSNGRVPSWRAVLALTLAVGSGTLEQGCAHVDKKEDPGPLAPPAERARLVGEQGKFLEALQLYTRANIKNLTKADHQNIETFQDGLEEKIQSYLKEGHELASSEKDSRNNYPEALASLKLAFSRMDKEHPDYKKTEKEIDELQEKIAALKKEYFELSYNKIADLYLADDYLRLAGTLQRMNDIVLALNRDPALFEKEHFLEICWQIGEQYFKRKKFKEALFIFKLAERFLLPGQAMPVRYKDMTATAEYWHKKKWKEAQVKIRILQKEAKNTDRKRLEEIRADLAELEAAVSLKKEAGLSEDITAVIEEVESAYAKKVTKPKRRRRWRRRRPSKMVKKPVEKPTPEPPKPAVDIEKELEDVNTLLDEGHESRAIARLRQISQKHPVQLVRQKRKVSFTLKRLSDLAEDAYTNQQAQKALRYYRAILLLDPSNARANKQVRILEGLIKEVNGL